MLFVPIYASGLGLAANSKTFTRQQKRSKIQYMSGKAWNAALAKDSVHHNRVIEMAWEIMLCMVFSDVFFLRYHAMSVFEESSWTKIFYLYLK